MKKSFADKKIFEHRKFCDSLRNCYSRQFHNLIEVNQDKKRKSAKFPPQIYRQSLQNTNPNTKIPDTRYHFRTSILKVISRHTKSVHKKENPT